MTNSARRILYVGYAASGMSSVIRVTSHTINNGYHALQAGKRPRSVRVLPFEETTAVADYEMLPVLRDWYESLVDKDETQSSDIITGLSDPEDGLLPESFKFRVLIDQLPGEPEAELVSIGRDTSSQLDRFSDEVIIDRLEIGSNPPNYSRDDLEHYITTYDAIHIFVTCQEKSSEDSLQALSTFLHQLAEAIDMAVQRKQSTPQSSSHVELAAIVVGLTCIDLAYYGNVPVMQKRPHFDILVEDTGFLKRFMERRLTGRKSSFARGDIAFTNLLIGLNTVQESLSDAQGPHINTDIPIIPMSSFGGVHGIGCLNTDAYEIDGAPDELPELSYRPRLATLTQFSSLQTSDKAQHAVSLHRPFQSADGLLYILERLDEANWDAPVSSLIPGCRMQTVNQVLNFEGVSKAMKKFIVSETDESSHEIISIARSR